MCDIIVALPDATASGRVLFGKNSDRPAGECQVWYDASGEPREERVRCAFVEVPVHSAPLRTRGLRPYWCWGYETGANEAGVVAGNTAVYTRSLYDEKNRATLGLTGMELLRLGLERGRTAQDTVDAITALLAEYGQWAPAVQGKGAPEGCYENAFLVADAREAWILETAGRRWAARRFTSGVHALSNQLTIRGAWTRASDDLARHAVTNGWWPAAGAPLDFARAYSDHEHYARQVSQPRWSRAMELLNTNEGRIGAATVMSILRDHYEETFLRGPSFGPYLPDMLTLCMHQSPAGFTWGNTATSLIVEIDAQAPGSSPCWWSYQPPCTSVFLPSTLDGALPALVTAPGTAGLCSQDPALVPADSFDANSLWWRLFRLLRAVASEPHRRSEVRAAFDPIESQALERVQNLHDAAPAARTQAIQAGLEEALSAVTAALDRFESRWPAV